jgi:signal transduction histidine kinase
MDAPLSSLAENGPLATTLLADLLLEQTWAASAPETWFAAPLIVVVTCAFAMSQSVARGRRMSDAIECLSAMTRAHRGADAVIAAALRELRVMAAAREILIALDGRCSPTLLFRSADGLSDDAVGHPRTIARDKRTTYFFTSPDARPAEVAILDGSAAVVPDAFRQLHPHERMVTFALEAGEWHGRLFALDPGDDVREPLIDHMQSSLGTLLPALERVCDLHWRRHHAEARERARLGRELHDGLAQELTCLDMELELVGVASADSSIRGRIGGIQQRLRSELRDLRKLIQDARYNDVDAARLPAVLEAMVQRFGRDADVEADYVSQVSDVRLPPRVCGEIARIVEEALVNVRRHSGARRVMVTFSCNEAEWNLSIQDDGRGFGKGRRGTSAAPQAPLPPSVIHERVHSLGGTVRVIAGRPSGARLEISARRRDTCDRMA